MGVETLLDLAESLRDREVGGGADHADADQAERPADRSLDDTDAAPGQAGVDSQHAHG